MAAVGTESVGGVELGGLTSGGSGGRSTVAAGCCTGGLGALGEYYACLREYISVVGTVGVSEFGGSGAMESARSGKACSGVPVWYGPTGNDGWCAWENARRVEGGGASGVCFEEVGGLASRRCVDVVGTVVEERGKDTLFGASASVECFPESCGVQSGDDRGVGSAGDRVGERAVGSDGDGSAGGERVVGKHAKSNARKRANQKKKRAGLASGFPPSVVTVSTEMAEEIEARRTLALKRSAENKVAVALAGHRLRSLGDSDKTKALAKLEAARLEQRVNDAKAKSQASYKKCDESLGSLGSTGSAGEFALKKEVQAAKDEVLSVKREKDYYEKQLNVAMGFLPPEGMRAVAELPEPVYDDDRVDDCGLDELPEGLSVNDKVAYLTRMGCQDAAEALLFETYGF